MHVQTLVNNDRCRCSGPLPNLRGHGHGEGRLDSDGEVDMAGAI